MGRLNVPGLMMGKTKSACWSCCLWFVVAFLTATGPADASGRLVELSWDFGFVPQKSVVSHLFYLKNTTDIPLTITEIKPGCSCTSVSEVKGAVAPEDSVGVRITFKSGRYHRGLQKTTGVRTDNPGLPAFKLKIKAHVVRAGEVTGGVKITPPKVTWELVENKITHDADTLLIINDRPDSLSLTFLDVPNNGIECYLTCRVIPPGDSARLVLIPPRTPIGKATPAWSLTVEFAAQDRTRITIPIRIKH